MSQLSLMDMFSNGRAPMVLSSQGQNQLQMVMKRILKTSHTVVNVQCITSRTKHLYNSGALTSGFGMKVQTHKLIPGKYMITNFNSVGYQQSGPRHGYASCTATAHTPDGEGKATQCTKTNFEIENGNVYFGETVDKMCSHEFDAADTNGDGFLSQDEHAVLGHKSSFVELDKNNDNMLSLGEASSCQAHGLSCSTGGTISTRTKLPCCNADDVCVWRNPGDPGYNPNYHSLASCGPSTLYSMARDSNKTACADTSDMTSTQSCSDAIYALTGSRFLPSDITTNADGHEHGISWDNWPAGCFTKMGPGDGGTCEFRAFLNIGSTNGNETCLEKNAVPHSKGSCPYSVTPYSGNVVNCYCIPPPPPLLSLGETVAPVLQSSASPADCCHSVDAEVKMNACTSPGSFVGLPRCTPRSSIATGGGLGHCTTASYILKQVINDAGGPTCVVGNGKPNLAGCWGVWGTDLIKYDWEHEGGGATRHPAGEPNFIMKNGMKSTNGHNINFWLRPPILNMYPDYAIYLELGQSDGMPNILYESQFEVPIDGVWYTLLNSSRGSKGWTQYWTNLLNAAPPGGWIFGTGAQVFSLALAT